MKQRVLFAWRNLWRKPLRSALLVIGSAITAATLFLSYFFLVGIERSTEAGAARLGADVMVVPKSYGAVAEQILLSGDISPFYMPATVLDKLRKIPEIEQMSPQLYLETYSGTCCQVEGDFPVIAFDPETDFTLKAFVAETGRPFLKDSVLLGSEAGGKNALYHLHYKAYNERLTLFNRTFQVADVLFPTGTGADRTIYMDLASVRELRKDRSLKLTFPEDSVSAVMLKTGAGDAEFVKRQVERLIPEASAVTGLKVRERIEQQLRPLRYFAYAMIAVVLLMATLQTMTLFSALVAERMREIGMFRALGASRGTVYRLLLLEAWLASSLGALIGVFLVATTLADNRAVLTKSFQLPLLFPGLENTIRLGLLAVLATGLISVWAASVPIRSIVRRQPYDAIREGE
jgi:putative ABC transport system permease protein